jgi:hypothetical protein
MGVDKPFSVEHLDMIFQFLGTVPHVSVPGDQGAIRPSAEVHLQSHYFKGAIGGLRKPFILFLTSLK